MSNDLKDILGNSNKDIDNQQLMDYLSSQLNKTTEHEVEKAMADDEFMNDAVEGLQQVKNKKEVQAYVDQLNDELQKQIAKNKKRRDKRRLKDSPYTYVVIVMLLLLLIISFVLVKKYLDSKKSASATTPGVLFVKGKNNNQGNTHL